ncbi:MAG: hypothetical protein ACNA8G_01365 [Gammaproteobacteria bacterium]
MKALCSLAAALVLGAAAIPAQAFEAEFDAAPPQAIALGEISVGPALAAKADEYGGRDLEQLVERMRGELERELARIGRLAGPEAGAAVLNVVIDDATPNRPTMQQQASVTRSLDPRSVFVGGAKVSATLLDSGGATLGRFAYAWQTTPDIRQSEFATTWTDAHRTLDRFATRLADAIAAESDSGR